MKCSSKKKKYLNWAIEKFDRFGHEIAFNFNGHIDEHKTFKGLVFSIIGYLIFLSYLFIIFTNILNGSNT